MEDRFSRPSKRRNLSGHHQIARWLIYWLLAAGLYGCSAPSLQDHLDDYLQRLSNTLDQPLPQLKKASWPGLPSYRERHQDLPDLRIDLLDFLDLDECGLQQLVAQRNSSLGKVMTDSQRLLYEHRFLQALRVCLTRSDKLPDELQTHLHKVLAIKQSTVPLVRWNASWGSREFAALFSRAAPAKPPGQTFTTANSREALIWLQTNFPPRPGQPVPDSATLESRYQTLEQGRHGGELLNTLQSYSDALQTATQLIEQRLARKPVCYRQTPSRSGRIAENILRKFYIQNLQPELAELDREGRAFLEAANASLSHHKNRTPKIMLQWQQNTLSLTSAEAPWQRYRRSVKQHAKAWQTLLQQCGLMPQT